jgi:hypothetical protein
MSDKSELAEMHRALVNEVKRLEHNGWDEIFPWLRRRASRLRRECTLVETVIRLHQLLLPLEPLP